MEVAMLQAAQMGSSPHPNILSLVDTMEDFNNDKIYMITKLATGGNLLSNIVRQNNDAVPASEDNIRRMALQLLQGVQHLHESAYITHNALHPANILLDTYGNVTIADFGAARPIEYCDNHNTDEEQQQQRNTFMASDRDFSHSSSSGTTLRTHGRRAAATKTCGRAMPIHNGYCAPERLHHRASENNSKAADMWSVGVILYFCFFGHDNDHEEQQQQELSQQALLVERVQLQQFSDERRRLVWHSTSRHAKQFLANLLHLDPAVRMTVTEALQHPWLADLVAVQQQQQPGWRLASSSTVPKKRGHRRGRRMLQRSLSKLASYF